MSNIVFINRAGRRCLCSWRCLASMTKTVSGGRRPLMLHILCLESNLSESDELMRRLQSAQNAAARLITGMQQCDK